MKRVLAALSLVTVLVTACEPVTHYNRVQVAALPGARTGVKERGTVRPYGSVKLFMAHDTIERPYKRIAMMSLEGDAGDEARFITAFLYRGADLGADAVVFYRVGESPEMKIDTGLWTSVKTKAHGVYSAEAIQFDQAGR